ncbi:hypothetical protein CPC16_002522, partial [Podila verticillata]
HTGGTEVTLQNCYSEQAYECRCFTTTGSSLYELVCFNGQSHSGSLATSTTIQESDFATASYSQRQSQPAPVPAQTSTGTNFDVSVTAFANLTGLTEFATIASKPAPVWAQHAITAATAFAPGPASVWSNARQI